MASRESASLWCTRIALVLAVFAPLGQWAVGAQFGPTGQQLTSGLPLPTMLLLAAGVLLVAAGERRLPFLSWAQILFVGLVSVGLLGLARQEYRSGVKELVQLGEVAILAPFVFRALWRRLGMPSLVRALALAFCLLLVFRFVPWSLGLSARKAGLLLALSFPFLLVAVLQLPSSRLRYLGAVLAGVLLGLSLDHGGLVLGAALSLVALASCQRRMVAPGLALAGLVVGSLVTPFAAPWSALDPHRDEAHLRRGAIELLATLRSPREYPLGAGLGGYQPAINRLRTEIPQQPHPEDNRVPQDGNCQYAVLLVEAGPAGFLGLALFLGLGCLAAVRALSGAETGTGERSALPSALAAAVVCAGFGLLLSRGVGIWAGGLVGLATLPATAPAPHRLPRLVACAAVVLAICLTAFLGNKASRDAGAPSRLNRHLAPSGAAPSPLRVVVLPDPASASATGDVLRIEAEAAKEIESPFAAVALTDASGGKGLVIPDHGGKGQGCAQYVVRIPKAGRYVLFARVYWDDGCSNSVRFQVGEQNGATLSSGTYGRWHTLENNQPMELSAGDQTVEIQNLEDGIRIDYWGLRPL